jgi:hypothetical protein
MPYHAEMGADLAPVLRALRPVVEVKVVMRCAADLATAMLWHTAFQGTGRHGAQGPSMPALVGGKTLFPVVKSKLWLAWRGLAERGNRILAKIPVVGRRLLFLECKVFTRASLDLKEYDKKRIELRARQAMADPFGKMQN